MLVISDAHSGLVSALTQALSGAAWQRCTVHFVRNVLAQIPHKDKKQVADALKLIFDQPDPVCVNDLKQLIKKFTL